MIIGKRYNLDKHGRLFHFISPVYRLFFNYQLKDYKNILTSNSQHLGISIGDSVLDAGCGTGAFSCALSKLGFKVTGVDVAPGMIYQAEQSCCEGSLEFIRGDVTEHLDFDDNSFDLVTAAYLAHGLNRKKRMRMYSELSRVTKKHIILQDFNTVGSLPVTIIEWMEGGGYFQFVKEGIHEMNSVFRNVKIIPVTKRLNWYILEP